MLVVTLRADESVMIGDDIEVTLVRSTGKQSRVGFEAPPDVPIHRREIYDRIQKEKLDLSKKQSVESDSASNTRVTEGSTE